MPLPNLVFLHGFLGVKEDWAEICTYLETHAHCIAFDLPGHGQASAITPHYLEELHTKIQLISSEAILVGYSMGGRLALELAHHYGYAHLILLSTHPGISDEAERRVRLEKDTLWIEKLNILDIRTFLEERYAQPLFSSLKKKPELLEKILQWRSREDKERLAEVLSMLTPGRMKPCFSFPKRTLFLYGESDEKFKALSQRLPDHVTVRGIADCGHILHLEEPATCAKHILKEVS